MFAEKSSILTEFAIASVLLFVGCIPCGSTFLLAQSSEQQQHPVSSPVISVAAQEFPVTLRQNIVAGKTPVGTKIEAKLTMATLVKGAVIPEGAIFSGEVVQSSAKSATNPSRLAIRIDSVQWKKESKPITLYLVPWYYPLLMRQDVEGDDQSDRPVRGVICGSASCREMSPNYDNTFPNPRTSSDTLPPPPPRVSESRVPIKDVDSARDIDGTIALTSTHSNIKLDKTTTYVLAANALAPGKETDSQGKAKH
jgi:hypothetical protein